MAAFPLNSVCLPWDFCLPISLYGVGPLVYEPCVYYLEAFSSLSPLLPPPPPGPGLQRPCIMSSFRLLNRPSVPEDILWPPTDPELTSYRNCQSCQPDLFLMWRVNFTRLFTVFYTAHLLWSNCSLGTTVFIMILWEIVSLPPVSACGLCVVACMARAPARVQLVFVCSLEK